MDYDSKPQRRKNLKTLLFGKRNFSLWKSPKISKRGSSICSDGDMIRSQRACSEEIFSQGSCFSQSWKGSFSRCLCWIKWNFLTSSSLRNSRSLASNIPKHEICNSLCPKIEAPVDTEPQNENFDGIMIEVNEENFNGIKREANEETFDGIKREAKEGKDCDDVKENEIRDCDDVSKKEDFCCDREDECHLEEGSLRKKMVRHFPPPLPSLARTGNLPCHMPWIHLRSYKTDGRLVIHEVKVRHHEFFRAKRANGRLTLHLVQHDEDKVRAHQAGLFKSEAKEKAIDAVKEDIDGPEESNELGDEEERDEAENVHNEETNGGNDSEGAEKRDGVADIESADKRIGVKVERGSSDEGPDEIFPCFTSFASKRLIPDSLQMQRQRFSGSHLQVNSSAVGYGSKGLDSPVGCCSPIANDPFFDRPISAIRPILS